MPVYQYRCEDCAVVFDVEKPYEKLKKKEKCKNCFGKNTVRIISVSPLIFKGDGFTLSNSGTESTIIKKGE